jgi:hypothetical protein
MWSSLKLFVSLELSVSVSFFKLRSPCGVLCACARFFGDCLVFVGYDKALTVLNGSSERKKGGFSAVLGV